MRRESLSCRVLMDHIREIVIQTMLITTQPAQSRKLRVGHLVTRVSSVVGYGRFTRRRQPVPGETADPESQEKAQNKWPDQGPDKDRM